MDSIFDYPNSPADDPALAGRRREWLREHPVWTIDGEGFVRCLIDAGGIGWEELSDYPGPLRLSARGGQLDARALARIGSLPGLAALQLHNGDAGDAAFAAFAKAARGLAHLMICDPAGKIELALPHLADLPNLRGLGIFRNVPFSDTSFLAELAGGGSPRALSLNCPEALLDSALDRIAGWTNLEWCSLSVADGVRDDLPWLAGLERLRWLELDFDGPLTAAGLARLGGLAALTKLELSALSFDLEGVRHLANLENLSGLALYAEEGPRSAVAALAGCGKLRSLSLWMNLGPEKIEITTPELVNFAAIPELETLSHGMGFSAKADYSVLSAAVNLKEMNFNFWPSGPTDAGLEEIAEIRSLAKLELDGSRYSGRGLAALAALPNLADLEMRDLGEVKESTLACLAGFPALAGLTLDFEGNLGLAARRLSFLGRIGKLKSLRVEERGEWSAELVEDIAAATTLKSLELTGVWNLPTSWLAALGRLAELEEIIIDHCLDFRSLEFFRANRTLRRIKIRNCDNLPVKALLALRDIPLEEIDVGGLRHFTPVSGREFVALRLAWPEARVF